LCSEEWRSPVNVNETLQPWSPVQALSIGGQQLKRVRQGSDSIPVLDSEALVGELVAMKGPTHVVPE
jgi:hypothetical protein